MTPLEDAIQERKELLDQEIRHHGENQAAEMRRFTREVEHINKVFALRLGLD